MLWLLFALACKDAPVDSALDADGDGYASPEDCDDGDAAIHPSAAEICDGRDNDCDGERDANAEDAAAYYADLDTDGFGDEAAQILACAAPDNFIRQAGDCDDNDAAVHPGAAELCDGRDNDCDGRTDVDAEDELALYQDTDGDGFGDPRAPIGTCTAYSGLVDDNTDCDDGHATVNPEAPELCDEVDNDCDGATDEGVRGQGADCPASSCAALAGLGHPDGSYYIDPDGDFSATLAACDLSTDGGGWTLIAWTNDGDAEPRGVPYPGLAVCEGAGCARGSAADRAVLTALIGMSGEIAVAQAAAARTSVGSISAYEEAGVYDYGTLAQFSLAAPGNQALCDTTGFARGTFRALFGSTDFDGAFVHLAPAFRYNAYGLELNDYDESASYLWSPGTPYAPCNASGDAPGSWLGNSSERESGPLSPTPGGARSVWVR